MSAIVLYEVGWLTVGDRNVLVRFVLLKLISPLATHTHRQNPPPPTRTTDSLRILRWEWEGGRWVGQGWGGLGGRWRRRTESGYKKLPGRPLIKASRSLSSFILYFPIFRFWVVFIVFLSAIFLALLPILPCALSEAYTSPIFFIYFLLRHPPIE